MKNKLYIVFDQLPPKSSGGLVATYVSLSKLLKDEYDIEIISVFDYPKEAKEQFPDIKINVLNNTEIEIRFYRLFQYLRKGKIGQFFWSIASIFTYFLYIPFARKKMRKLIGNDRVIVTSPSAAIFMSKKTKFILEIHIKYEYFWGNNKIARMQSKMMTTPTTTLFRSKRDRDECAKYHPELNPGYMYNFFNGSYIQKKEERSHKICFLGRLHEQKNLPRLVELGKLLKEKDPNFVLDIYGEGPLKDYLVNEIKKQGLENNFIIKGFTNDKTVYSDYSLLWLSSSYEGLALVIIEAAANYVPCISTNWGPAVYEEIDDGKSGYICEENEEFVEKTVELLSNKEKNEEFSSNARKLFELTFSGEVAKSNWISIIEKIFTK